MRIRPVAFTWAEVDVCVEGGEVRRALAMLPVGRFLPLCKRQYALGEEYALGPVEGIENGSRGGFFAACRETWRNLPEEDDRFPTPEHLRKTALVKAGWAYHSQAVFDTQKDARKHALGLRKVEGYAVITRSGNVVDCWIAKSIAGGQITADEWRTVKPLALAFLASLTGVTAKELERHSADGGGR